MELSPSPSIPDPDPAPHKCKITATARLRENANPLLPKNKRARIAAPKVKQTLSTLKAQATGLDPQRCQSVEDEESSNDKAEGHLKVPGSDIVDQAVVIAVDVDMDPIDVTEILSDSDAELKAIEESCKAELSKNIFNDNFQKINTHLDRLSKEWTAPIYAFFHATPLVKYVSGCRIHTFQCLAKNCRAKNGREVRCYLDTSDRKSTSNLRKHVKVCWGSDQVAAADSTKDAEAACNAIETSKLKDGSLTASFKRMGKDRVRYSHCQRTMTETRYAMPSFSSPTCTNPRTNPGRRLCVGFVRAGGHLRL